MSETVLLETPAPALTIHHPFSEVENAARVESILAKIEDGIDEEHRDTMRAFEDGVLLDLDIGKKSWKERLTPSDFGLKEFPENFTPGHRRLLPEEPLGAIEKIEGAARRFVDKQSFRFGSSKHDTEIKKDNKGGSGRGRIRFVRNRHVGDILMKLEEYQASFYKAVEDLIANYEQHKVKMRQDFPQQWPLIEDKYPEVSAIRNAYYFIFNTYEMALPRKFRHQDLSIYIARKDADEEYRSRLENVLQAQANQAQRRMSEFVDESLRSLRGKVVQTFEKILAKRKEDKELIGKNIKSIRDAIAYVEEMDFLNDYEFRNQLEEIKRRVDSGVTFKDNAEATVELERLMQGTVEFVTRTTDEAVAKAQLSYFGRDLDV